MNMITYNDVYEAARKERYSEQLQNLSKKFIIDVADYLKEKKEMTSKEDDVFSDVVTIVFTPNREQTIAIDEPVLPDVLSITVSPFFKEPLSIAFFKI